MKRYIPMLLMATMALLALTGCKKDEEAEVQSVVGTWELVTIETKSAMLDGTPVSVTLSFMEDGTFTITQLVGVGRESSYTGTYVFSDGLLSGTYNNDKPWGDTYSVAFADDRMSLTSSDGKETDTYKKVL